MVYRIIISFKIQFASVLLLCSLSTKCSIGFGSFENTFDDPMTYYKYDKGNYDRKKVLFANSMQERITLYYPQNQQTTVMPSSTIIRNKFSDYLIKRIYSEDEIDRSKDYLVFYLSRNRNPESYPVWKEIISHLSASIIPFRYTGLFICSVKGKLNGKSIEYKYKIEKVSYISVFLAFVYPIRYFFTENYEDVCFYHLLNSIELDSKPK